MTEPFGRPPVDELPMSVAEPSRFDRARELLSDRRALGLVAGAGVAVVALAAFVVLPARLRRHPQSEPVTPCPHPPHRPRRLHSVDIGNGADVDGHRHVGAKDPGPVRPAVHAPGGGTSRCVRWGRASAGARRDQAEPSSGSCPCPTPGTHSRSGPCTPPGTSSGTRARANQQCPVDTGAGVTQSGLRARQALPG